MVKVPLQKNRETVKVRRPYFLFVVIAASLLVTAVSVFSTASDFAWINLGNSTFYLNNNTVQLNGTVMVNGSVVCTEDYPCGASDGNNYPTSLSVNSSGSNYQINLGRNGLSTLIAPFTVSSSGGVGSNISFSNGSSGLWGRFTNSTNIEGSSFTCPVGYAIDSLSSVSSCIAVVSNEVDPVYSAASSTLARTGNCVGENTTHINVTVNTTTSGVQCYPVAKNPGSGSGGGNSTQEIINAVNNTGINITGNSFNSYALGGLPPSSYYLASNPSGYITGFTEVDPVFSALWPSIYSNVTNIQVGVSSLNSTSLSYNNSISNLQSTVSGIGNWSGNISSYTTTIQGDSRWSNQSFNVTCSPGTFPISFAFNKDGTQNGTTCGTDQTGGGGFTYSNYFDQVLNTTSTVQFSQANILVVNNTNVTYKNNYVEPYAFQTQNFKCFESELGGTAAAPNSNMNSPFYVQTISSGAVVGTTSGGDNHSLISTLRDSTTANGGSLIGMSQVNAGQFTPQSGDEYRAIVRFINGKAVTVTTKIGFMDTQSITDATDGCHIQFVSNTSTATARCRAASVTTANATTYTYSNATWYGVSVIHPTSSTANFTIWSDTGAVLWNVGLTSGVNTAASNPQLISTQNTTDAASDLIDVDYVGFCRKYKPQRAWSYGQ